MTDLLHAGRWPAPNRDVARQIADLRLAQVRVRRARRELEIAVRALRVLLETRE